jgi:hypothetical protein
MTLDNIIWLALFGVVIYMMTRKGGCCGGHTNEHSSHGEKKEDS